MIYDVKYLDDADLGFWLESGRKTRQQFWKTIFILFICRHLFTHFLKDERTEVSSKAVTVF